MQDLLSKVTRYEALFELAGAINRAESLESVSEVLARRIKYVADVFSWRYICFDGDPETTDKGEVTAILVDGHRGRADITQTTWNALSKLEMELWRDRETSILSGDAMISALDQLPAHFNKDDLEQISVNTLVESGKARALFVFSKRRRSFSDLDFKCLSMVCGFFHSKIHMLWEQQKLRDLELAYLKQEVMLRQNEKLATLGRMSAGMAHELNNPSAAARQGADHLKSSLAGLGRAQIAVGALGLSSAQREQIAQLEAKAEDQAKKPRSLDPIARSDLEQEVEDWLDRRGIEEPWDRAPTLVNMGFGVSELDDLARSFDAEAAPLVIDYISSRFAATALLEEIAHGTRRISEIVKALKSYSHMDEAPVQSVDVREGLNDTLVMLGSRLRDGIKVDIDYAEDLPRIPAYGSELNQVWTNLIDNAIGAMGGKGVLELRAYPSSNWVVVEVADTGVGIPLDVQESVFDPFFTTKAPGEGTGLGLSISHGIVVEKHKGQISVDSKPGATRFTVRLPVTGPGSTPAGGVSERLPDPS